MKTLSTIITSLAFAAPLTVASAVHADDQTPSTSSNSSTSSASGKQDVTMDQLPSAVRSAVQRETKNKTVQSITKSTDAKGGAAYEVKYLDGNKETTIDLAASGKVTARHVGGSGTDSGQSNQSKSDTRSDTKPDAKSDMKSDTKSNDTRSDDTRQSPQTPQPPQSSPAPKS
jgi:hypothetical protein